MIFFRQVALTLALLGAALPMYADSPSASNLTAIRAQFAAKDATIADLQKQVTEQAARIADLQQQAANTLTAPAMSTWTGR